MVWSPNLKRPTMSKSTARLLAALKAATPGDLISYDRLAGMIGVDPEALRTGRANSWLATARRRLLRDDKVVTRCEPGVGVRLLLPEEVLPATQARLRKTRRAANRTVDDGTTLEGKPEGVTEVQWLAHQTRIQIADLIRSSAREASVKRELVKASNGERQDYDLDRLRGV